MKSKWKITQDQTYSQHLHFLLFLFHHLDLEKVDYLERVDIDLRASR